MQLNTELTEILTSLGKILPNDFIEKQLELSDSTSITMSVKTPNIFYKKYYVFISDEKGSTDITDQLSQDNLKELKSCMSQAYWNYFTHYHQQWSKKYYTILFERDKFKNNSLVPVDALDNNTI
jgi:hypothetical protein